MNKTELIDKVASKGQMTKADAARAVGAFIETVTESLVGGEDVVLVGFGTFKVSQRSERSGRNPQTGQPLVIPAQTTARFSAGKQLKDAVNKKKKS